MLLGEEFLLIAYKEKKKQLPLGGMGMFLKNVMPATVLSDLRLAGKISLLGDAGKKKYKTLWVNPIDDRPLNISILDDVYDIIRNHTKKGKRALSTVEKWINVFGKDMKNLQSRMWSSLVQKGIMKQEGKKKYALIKPEVRRELIERIHAAVTGKIEPNAKTIVIIGYIENAIGWYMTDIKNRNKKLARSIANKAPISNILRWNVITKKKQKVADAAFLFSFYMGQTSQVTIHRYIEANDLILD